MAITTKVGSLAIDFAINTAQLRAGFQQANKELNAFGNDVQGLGKSLTRNLTLPLLAIGGVSAKLASDAEQATQKFNAAFGPLADGFQGFLDDLQKSVPESTIALQDMGATLQALLVPMGILPREAAEFNKQFLQIAGDLSAFNNIDVGRVFQDLQSGLAGQFRPLRKYGILLSETQIKQEAYLRGLSDSNQIVSAAARAQTLLQIILEKTTIQQGSAAREADSMATSFRALVAELKDLGAAFGEVLLPILLPIVRLTTRVLEVFTKLPVPLRAVIVGFGALAAAAGPLVLALNAVSVASAALLTTSGAAGIAGLAAALGPAAPFVLAVAGAAAVLGTLVAALKSARAESDGFTDSLAGASTDQLRANLERLNAEQQKAIELRNIFLRNRDSLRDRGLDDSINAKRLGEAQIALSAVNRELEATRTALNGLSDTGAVEAIVPPEAVARLTDVQNLMVNLVERQGDINKNARLLGPAYNAAAQEMQALSTLMADVQRAGVDLAGDLPDGIQAAISRLRELERAQGLEDIRSGAELAGRAMQFFVESIPDAVEIPGVPKAEKEVDSLSDSVGALGAALGELDSFAGSVFRNIAGIIDGLATGGAAGALGAIGIGAGLIKGIFNQFQEDPAARRTREENTAAVDRLTRGVANLGTDILNFSGNVFQGALDATQSFFDNFDLGSFKDPLDALASAAARSGITMDDLQRIARSLGVTLDDSLESVAAFTKALRADVIAQAFASFGGQLDIITAKAQVAGDGFDQFGALLSLLTETAGGSLAADFAAITPANAQAAILAIIEKLPTLTPEELGGLDPNTLTQLLVQLNGLADGAAEAGQALSDVAGILNAPSGFKIALERFNATDPEEVPRLIGTIGGGTGGGVVIQGDLIVQNSDPKALWDDIQEQSRRQANRGGTSVDIINSRGTRY